MQTWVSAINTDELLNKVWGLQRLNKLLKKLQRPGKIIQQRSTKNCANAWQHWCSHVFLFCNSYTNWILQERNVIWLQIFSAAKITKYY